MNTHEANAPAAWAGSLTPQVTAIRSCDWQMYKRSILFLLEVGKAMLRGLCMTGIVWLSLWSEWKALTWAASWVFGG